LAGGNLWLGGSLGFEPTVGNRVLTSCDSGQTFWWNLRAWGTVRVVHNIWIIARHAP